MLKLPEGNLGYLAADHKTVGSFSHLESANGNENFGTQKLEIGKHKIALVKYSSLWLFCFKEFLHNQYSWKFRSRS